MVLPLKSRMSRYAGESFPMDVVVDIRIIIIISRTDHMPNTDCNRFNTDFTYGCGKRQNLIKFTLCV